ncbi:Gfo/Idh/MocA family oxidoreductase [Sphingomonas sp. AR_OL41]|uniref:Gfo/Idh/MocA family protein n=1 Tax=Sphingomonas sp. AR_OL41 TaxID=3042729 RepID=UPI00247FA714|nr:Gfo/Idh/MocA family oxidoreductase [Sphingomonas sp. AR_OL41]MDH7971936.1 Gfo/Idh/MocA family oxidoreductase [Sphingomonas sp. AR_OL41]
MSEGSGAPSGPIRVGPIRVGLVGIGKIARDQHVPALAADSRFTLVATASRHGHVDGVPAYPDIAAMLAGPERLDAVSLCTPPEGRLDIAREAIAAGMAVMLEKPPAATLAEAEALVAAARAAGVPLFTSWHSREAAAVEDARAWLVGKTVSAVRVTWKEDIRRWHPGQEWILAEGGFGVFDPGINALSIVTALLAEPVIVERAHLRIPAGRGSPIQAMAALRAGTVPIAVDLDFLQTGPQSWDIEIETDAGAVTLTDGGATIAFDGGAAVTAPNREYPRLYARFAELVATGGADVDLAPLRIVTDALTIGSREEVAPFDF